MKGTTSIRATSLVRSAASSAVTATSASARRANVPRAADRGRHEPVEEAGVLAERDGDGQDEEEAEEPPVEQPGNLRQAHAARRQGGEGERRGSREEEPLEEDGADDGVIDERGAPTRHRAARPRTVRSQRAIHSVAFALEQVPVHLRGDEAALDVAGPGRQLRGGDVEARRQAEGALGRQALRFDRAQPLDRGPAPPSDACLPRRARWRRR